MATKDEKTWDCPKCGKQFTGDDAGPETIHGWPEKNDPPELDEETGAEKWHFVTCADATDAQVQVYRNAKEFIRRMSGGEA